MKKSILVLMAVVFLSSCSLRPDPSQPGLPEEELQLALDESRAAGGLIGVSAAIMDGNGNQWKGVSGISHPQHPITPETVFDMGSAGKVLAAALMLELAQEGLIDLDASVGAYIAPPPGVAGSIPIRSLLNHSSGLANAVEHPDSPFRGPYDQIEFDRWWEIEEIFTELSAPALFQPGEGWHYSQAGYQIATLIVQEVTGASIAENIQARLLDPQGIDGMVLDFSQPLPPGVNIAHNWVDLHGNGIPTDVSDRPRSWIASFSRILFYTTAEDFARWGQALFSGQVLEPDSLEQMLDFVEITDHGNEPPIFSGYGLGVVEWIPELLNGHYGYGHSGSIPGYRAFLAYLPEHDLTIAVLSNSDREEELGALINNLLEVALGTPAPAGERASLEIDPRPSLPKNMDAASVFSDASLFCDHQTSWTVEASPDQWLDLSLDWVVASTPELAEDVWGYHNHQISVNGLELEHLEDYLHPVINYVVECPDGRLDLYARGFSIYLPPLDPGEYELVWRSEVTGRFHNGFVEYRAGDYLEARAILQVVD